MEIDTLLDAVGGSCVCCGCLLESVLLGLGSMVGRNTILLFKLLGLIFDIVAIVSIYDIVSTPELIHFFLPSFMFYERILVLLFICVYGCHPSKEYEQRIGKETKEEAKEMDLVVNQATSNTPTDHKDNIKDEKNGQTSTIDTESKSDAETKTNSNDRTYSAICCEVSDNPQLESIRTLWYGSLWSTFDYIAQIAKSKQGHDANCILVWYFFSISVLWGIGTMTVFAGLIHGSMGGQHDGPGPVGDFIVWMVVFANFFGLFQHMISFGILFNQQRKEIAQDKETNECCSCGKCVKCSCCCIAWVWFIPIGGGSFIAALYFGISGWFYYY